MRLQEIFKPRFLASFALLGLTLFGTVAHAKGAAKNANGEKVVYDHWYTVTVNKKVHYEYYRERLAEVQGRLRFTNEVWKKEEDFINEEQLGAFALNDEVLTPEFFNFHSTYRASETKIDGNVKDRELVVRITKDKQDLAPIKKTVPAKAFWSVFFPVWLARQLPTLRPGQTKSFMTILEDNIEAAYAPMVGTVRAEKPDALALKTHTAKLTVDYRDLVTIWWVDPDGSALRIEMPAQNTVSERVSESVAKSFLKQ